MKKQALGMITNVQNWLQNINSIAIHPYSAGVNVPKVIEDLGTYMEELKGAVESIEEVSTDIENDASEIQ